MRENALRAAGSETTAGDYSAAVSFDTEKLNEYGVLSK
jgi:hypothetical protein